ncbi:unnamed protein product [Moneuplotes crassus]|uniref:Ubiquitin carboxyl-terminal hydrolase n=1 Tax=Euplotes crassus TaxID=5936 RepID=A0AAD1UFR8_EUPCR|nr:unnamed protein product [Moneuplotes crassus]
MPTGLFNIGNTCFANSVLQCILHTPEMHQLITTLPIGEDEEGNSEGENESEGDSEYSSEYTKQPEFNNFAYDDDIPTYCCSLCGIKEIIQGMANSGKNFLPLGMKDIIKKVFGEEVRFGRQHDAHEFLMILLHTFEVSGCYQKAMDCIRQQRKFSKPKIVEINKVFEGSFTSNIQCQKCRRNNKNEQKFQDINLDIRETFEDSMRHYFSSEKLEGENKYDCEKCKQYTNAIKSISLKDPPLNLIVNLKKFDVNGAKIKAKIEYPHSFNLGDYIKSTGKGSRSKVANMYELYAVINHEGNFSHRGHYNCYVKGFDETWYRCDDSKIRRIGGQNQTSSEKAYILFYRLKKILSKRGPKRKAITKTSPLQNEETKPQKFDIPKPSKPTTKRKRPYAPFHPNPCLLPSSQPPSSLSKSSQNITPPDSNCSPKRFKSQEADNFDTTAEVSI